MSKYAHLDKDSLVRLLERRDAERQLGLVWERDEIEADAALNEDFVALDLDAALSHGDAPWDSLVIEGDNYDALRALLEVKGSQWWGDAHEVGKAEAVHADYGNVFMVGRERGKADFVQLRKLGDRLQSAGGFDIARMRW